MNLGTAQPLRTDGIEDDGASFASDQESLYVLQNLVQIILTEIILFYGSNSIKPQHYCLYVYVQLKIIISKKENDCQNKLQNEEDNIAIKVE